MELLIKGVSMSECILSADVFFTKGLVELLGEDFINESYIIVDLDCFPSSKNDLLSSRSKNVIGFASNDFSCYLAEKMKVDFILNKKSAIKDIIDFFLFRKEKALYYSHAPLTVREKQLLGLVCTGASPLDLAISLGVKTKTIYTFRRNIMIKLGCNNRLNLQQLWNEKL